MVVQDHEDGGDFNQGAEAAFFVEGVEEGNACDVWQELHGDATAEEMTRFLKAVANPLC